MKENNTVLIIEKDKSLQKILKKSLKNSLCEIVIIDNIEQKLFADRRISPGVIVISASSYPALLEKIKDDNKFTYTKLIIIANKDEIPDYPPGFDVRVYDFLVIPFTPEEVRVRVRAALSFSKLQAELVEQGKRLERMNRLNEWDLHIASQVQHSILHLDYPANRGLKFAARYLACSQLKGDLIDTFISPDGKIGVMVADVSGHGASASLITILFRTLFRTLALEESSPAKALKTVNRALLEPLADIYSFVTAAYAVFDPKTKKLTYSTAAHPALLLSGKRGKIDSLEAPGMMLGMFSDYWCNEGEIQLQSGDRILLYTDGLVDQKNKNRREFGLGRVKKIIRENRAESLDETLDRIIISLQRFAGGIPLEDDFSIFMIEVE